MAFLKKLKINLNKKLKPMAKPKHKLKLKTLLPNNNL